MKDGPHPLALVLFSSLSAALLFAAAVPGTLHAETLFDSRAGLGTIKAYQGYLDQVRAKLLSSDDDASEDALEVLDDTLDAVKDDGDAVFPLVLLGDLVTGTGAADPDDLDDDLQEEALDLIIEVAKSGKSVSHREIAIEQLGRVVAAPELGDMDWASDSVQELVTIAEGGDLVLMHAALVALGRLAVQPDDDWEDEAELAAETIADRLEDDDPEVRRIALSVAIRSLMLAKESTDATEQLWDQLEEAIGDIESPALQDEVKVRVTALMAKHQGGVFQDEVDAVRDELKGLKSARKPSSDNLETCLKELRGETDPVDLDACLAKVERAVKDNPSARTAAMSTLVSIGADPAVPAYKLRYLTDALFTIAVEAKSPLTFHRASAGYAELTAQHRGSGRAAIPLTALARLLASADQPALLAPALQEARTLAAGNLPHWIRRRLVAAVFLQAGDAVDPGARMFAFQQLSALGGTDVPWPVRYESYTRIRQLATLAKHPDVKDAAAQWN